MHTLVGLLVVAVYQMINTAAVQAWTLTATSRASGTRHSALGYSNHSLLLLGGEVLSGQLMRSAFVWRNRQWYIADLEYAGFSHQSVVSSVRGFDVFDLQRGSVRTLIDGAWTAVSSAPSARNGYCSATIAGRVLVVGGIALDAGRRQFDSPLDDVYWFDLDSRVWSPAARIPRKLYDASCVEFNGSILVFAGLTYENSTAVVNTNVYSYNIAENTWSIDPGFAGLPPIYGQSVVNVNNNLYSMGGCTLSQNGFIGTVSDVSLWNGVDWVTLASTAENVCGQAIVADQETGVIFAYGGGAAQPTFRIFNTTSQSFMDPSSFTPPQSLPPAPPSPIEPPKPSPEPRNDTFVLPLILGAVGASLVLFGILTAVIYTINLKKRRIKDLEAGKHARRRNRNRSSTRRTRRVSADPTTSTSNNNNNNNNIVNEEMEVKEQRKTILVGKRLVPVLDAPPPPKQKKKMVTANHNNDSSTPDSNDDKILNVDHEDYGVVDREQSTLEKVVPPSTTASEVEDTALTVALQDYASPKSPSELTFLKNDLIEIVKWKVMREKEGEWADAVNTRTGEMGVVNIEMVGRVKELEGPILSDVALM